MSMKLKTFATILALFCFSASLFAQPVTYSFSGFGGGLPASAKKVAATRLSDTDTATAERIIISEDDSEDSNDKEYDYYDEPKVNKSKKAALITTYVVIGVVVAAGIVVGAVYLSNESAQCCESTSQNLADGCAEGCGEAMGEACGKSMSESCSSSSSSANCSTKSFEALLAGNFTLLPVFVP